MQIIMPQNSHLNATIEEARYHTANNHHTDALISFALYLHKKIPHKERAFEMLKALQSVKNLHNYYGYLTPALGVIRDDLTKEILFLLSPAEREAFTKSV